MVRISAIVRADNGGLGTLSSLFAHGLGFHRTISLSRIAGEHHPERFGEKNEGGRMNDESDIPNSSFILLPSSFPSNRHAGDGRVTPELVEWACRGADVLLSFETWYGDTVPAMAHALGVKTALVPMVECCPREDFGLPDTDLAICPHAMCLDEMRDQTPGLSRAVKTLLPPPCDVERIEFHQRGEARVFVHHVGHAGSSDRNNTSKVIAAWQYVTTPAQLVLRSQNDLPHLPDDSRISVVRGSPANYWEMWNQGKDEGKDEGGRMKDESGTPNSSFILHPSAFRNPSSVGDVYLHPHRWEGCGLPIYEALASGMPVMTTRWWPFCDEREEGKDEGGRMKDEPGTPNSSLILHPSAFRNQGWLPPSSQALSIEVTARRPWTVFRQVMSHETTPRAIAEAVDRIYGTDLTSASRESRDWAEAHSWRTQATVWRQLFEDLAAGRLGDAPEETSGLVLVSQALNRCPETAEGK
ncbi:MAG TPA: glycosyltransferase family 4 protein [Pirellulales bacterium]|nr:glycosyltransferase family 4 protein [Pirellulales bacterium]